jgi:hypothetical protein
MQQTPYRYIQPLKVTVQHDSTHVQIDVFNSKQKNCFQTQHGTGQRVQMVNKSNQKIRTKWMQEFNGTIRTK